MHVAHVCARAVQFCLRHAEMIFVHAVLFYSFKVVQGRLVGIDVSTVRSWACQN